MAKQQHKGAILTKQTPFKREESDAEIRQIRCKATVRQPQKRNPRSDLLTVRRLTMNPFSSTSEAQSLPGELLRPAGNLSARQPKE